MNRPVIGLTCNELDKENLPKQFINEAYINSVIRAGGCPIILPITNDFDTIQAQAKMLDGLIVTGGIDVNPMIYNENPESLQDLSYCKRSVLKHAQQEKRENPSHKIHIEKDSFLYKSLGDEAMVNSFHHQAIKDLAPNFKVSAKSSDGIIEAIEHESFPIYAVQFHPEAMSHKYGEMQAIFNEFLKNCEVK